MIVWRSQEDDLTPEANEIDKLMLRSTLTLINTFSAGSASPRMNIGHNDTTQYLWQVFGIIVVFFTEGMFMNF